MLQDLSWQSQSKAENSQSQEKSWKVQKAQLKFEIL
jgi:hypothetical protein